MVVASHHLMAMGFSSEQAQGALQITGNGDVELALSLLLANTDGDLGAEQTQRQEDDPLPAGSPRVSTFKTAECAETAAESMSTYNINDELSGDGTNGEDQMVAAEKQKRARRRRKSKKRGPRKQAAPCLAPGHGGPSAHAHKYLASLAMDYPASLAIATAAMGLVAWLHGAPVNVDSGLNII